MSVPPVFVEQFILHYYLSFSCICFLLCDCFTILVIWFVFLLSYKRHPPSLLYLSVSLSLICARLFVYVYITHNTKKQHAQSLLSYDLRANPEYTEAFALDSKSIREYLKGHMTVSGEEFQIAFRQRGLIRNLIGSFILHESVNSEGLAIFSDISHELCTKTQTYTTQVSLPTYTPRGQHIEEKNDVFKMLICLHIKYTLIFVFRICVCGFLFYNDIFSTPFFVFCI